MSPQDGAPPPPLAVKRRSVSEEVDALVHAAREQGWTERDWAVKLLAADDAYNDLSASLRSPTREGAERRVVTPAEQAVNEAVPALREYYPRPTADRIEQALRDHATPEWREGAEPAGSEGERRYELLSQAVSDALGPNQQDDVWARYNELAEAAPASPQAQEDPIGLVVDLIREHEAQSNPNAWETAGRIVARLLHSGEPTHDRGGER